MGYEQIAIALLGDAVAWMTQARGAVWQRWACIVGLLGQPFWLWATWRAGQMRMFAVSVVYTCAWVRGVWVHWINPESSTAPAFEKPPKSKEGRFRA